MKENTKKKKKLGLQLEELLFFDSCISEKLLGESCSIKSKIHQALQRSTVVSEAGRGWRVGNALFS